MGSRVERLTALRGCVYGVVAVLVLAVTHIATHPLGGGDVYWQLRAGDDILRTHALPTVDAWSYTVAGTGWNNHEWGFEVLVAWLVRAFGLGALRAMVLVLAGGSLAGVAHAVARRTSPAGGLLVATLFLSFASYKFIPAPQAVSMALFFGATCLFLREGLFRSLGWSVGLFAYLLVWANVTAEVLLFLPFLVADQVARCVDAPRRRWRTYVGVALACAAPLVTPRSSSVIEYALVGSAINRSVNGEFTHLWEPAQTVTATTQALAWWVVALYALWAVARVRAALRVSDGRWGELRRVAVGALATVAAVAFERNLWLLVIPVGQMLVAGVALARRRERAVVTDAGLLAGSVVIFVAWAMGASWTPLLAWQQLTTRAYWTTEIAPAAVPVGAGPFLASLADGARVYTDRTWASYVIWRAPRVRVFIDGRNREYPLAVHQWATEVWEGGPHTLAILDRTQTQYVLATPSWGVLPGVRSGPWRPVVGTRDWTVYARIAR